MKRAITIFFVLALLLTGCSKSTGNNVVTGDVVKAPDPVKLENIYDCKEKKTSLQAELDSMKTQLEDDKKQISDKLNELRKANTDEEKTTAAAQLRDLRQTGRELENSIDALGNALSGLNCQ